MSSTNKTPNYELSQFIGTDIPNPLTDYNGDMSKIDTAVGSLATIAGEAKESADSAIALVGAGTLDTEAQTLVGGINELVGVDNGLKSRMTSAENGINSLNISLATTNGAVTAVGNRVTTLETQAGNNPLNTVAQTLSGAVNELKADEDSLDARVTVLENVTTELDTEMSDTSENAVQNKVITDYVDRNDLNISNMVFAIAEQAEGETKSAIITAGNTSATITGWNNEINEFSFISIYTDTFGVVPSDVTYTATSVTITIPAQANDVRVAVMIFNRT